MVASRIIETKDIEWKKAKWFQNESLKELSPEAMAKLKASLNNNSFVMPFHVWKEGDVIWILDGHHRQKALQEMASEGVVIPDLLPATFINCADKKEAAKLLLIFSSIYAKIENSGLDEFLKMYHIEFDEVKLEIDLPEFSLPRFEQKFNPPIEIEEDEDVFEPVENPFVKHGDLFSLNEHLLLCGDALDMNNWKLLLGDRKADVIFTDPPYNLPANYIGNLGQTKHKDFAVAAGEMSEVEFMEWLKILMRLMVSNSRPGSIHFLCMDFRHIWHVTEAAREVYETHQPKQLCVWNKNMGANGDFYRAKHELVFVYKNGNAKHFSNLALHERVRYNVWDYPSANSLSNPDRDELKNHPTPKPVAMVRDALMDVSREGDLVLDFFMGSGSTLIAADAAKRIACGTEIDPAYCQNIIRRYALHCEKIGKSLNFNHLNGDLNLEHFLYEREIQ